MISDALKHINKLSHMIGHQIDREYQTADVNDVQEKRKKLVLESMMMGSI